MSARQRIPDDVREQIADAARAGRLSCREIARQHGISPGTVRNIVKAAGIVGAFARASTENATRARVVDMAARRAELAEKALDLAGRMVERATAPYTVICTTKDDVFREILDEPPANEVKAFATAYGIFLDKHMALIKFDTKEVANPAASSLVDRLAEMLHLDTGVDPLVDDGYPTPLPAPPDEDDDGYEAPDMAAVTE